MLKGDTGICLLSTIRKFQSATGIFQRMVTYLTFPLELVRMLASMMKMVNNSSFLKFKVIILRDVANS